MIQIVARRLYPWWKHERIKTSHFQKIRKRWHFKGHLFNYTIGLEYEIGVFFSLCAALNSRRKP